MNLFNFFNELLKENRIFTQEDIGEMSGDDYVKYEPAIRHQWGKIGIPTKADMANSDEVVEVPKFDTNGKQIKTEYHAKTDSLTKPQSTFKQPVLKPQSAPKPQNDYTQSSYKKPENKPLLKGAVHYNEYDNEFFNKLSNMDRTAGVVKDEVEKWVLSNLKFPYKNASDNFQNAVDDLKAAKHNKDALIINNFNEVKNKDIRDILTSLGVKENSRGVYHNENSKASQSIAESPEIDEFIAKNRNELENGNIKNGSLEYKATPLNLAKLLIDKNEQKSKDNFFGFQHVNLYKPQIKDGYFTTYVLDNYDYKHRNGQNFSTKMNNFGYKLQQLGELENYYNMLYIKKKLNW